MIESSLSASTLILDILAGASERRLPAQHIIRAGEIMGLSESTLRVALTRLVKSGKLEKQDRAIYALDTTRNRLQLDVGDWRARMGGMIDWHGDWVLIAESSQGQANATERRRHQRALSLRGFRQWKPHVQIRPNNLAGGLDGLRQDLSALGLSPDADLCLASGLTPAQSDRVLALWDIPALEQTYQTLTETVETSLARLDTLEPDAAARESLLTGRDLIRNMLQDPLLPQEVLHDASLRETADAIAHYQDHSRAIWETVFESA